MFESLAALTMEGVATGAAGVTILTVATLLIKRGFHIDVGKVHNGNAQKAGGKSERPEWCVILHEQLEKNGKERHETLVAGINEVKAGIQLLHERVNQVISK